jgi:hypothetical protein
VSKLSWGGWAGISAIASIVAVIIAILALWVPQSRTPPTASPSTSGPVLPPPTSIPAFTPSPTSTSTPEVPSVSLPSGEATEAVAYMDDYATGCGVGVTAGPASLNGTQYAHAIRQWAGTSNNSFTISRKAHQFHAIVGIDDTASDKVRAQFELQGDNGQQLFLSRVLSFGETQPVNVPIDGVLRITLRVKALSSVWGYAGWGDARITSPIKLEC